eukprot:gene13292-9130_t
MLHTAAVPLLPPSGATHAVSGYFSGVSAPKETLVFAQQNATLYRSTQDTLESGSPGKAANVRYGVLVVCSASRSSLLFDDTHVSFLKYDPHDLVFRTVGLVQLLDQEVPKEPCTLQPLLRVDNKGTFLAALVKRNVLMTFRLVGFGSEKTNINAESKVETHSKAGAVQLNAWGDSDSENEEEEKKGKLPGTTDITTASQKTGILHVGPIATFEFQGLRDDLRNIRDFHLVDSTGDPLLAVLYEKYPTWAGRVRVLEWQSGTVENHMLTCSITWISVAQSHSDSPKLVPIGDVHMLSFTTTHMCPLPSFAGISPSVLCVGAHGVSWVGAKRAFGCYINDYGEEEVKDIQPTAWIFKQIQWGNDELGSTADDLTRKNLNLANSAVITISTPRSEDGSNLSLLLITEDEGTVLQLRLAGKDHAMESISADLLLTGCYCSTLAPVEGNTYFIGSCCSDSLVVDLSNGFEPVQIFPVISPIRAATPVDDCSASTLTIQPELLDDAIVGSPYEALYRKVVVAPAMQSSRRMEDGMDIALACGKGAAGSLCILRNSIRDEVIPSGNLHGSYVFFIHCTDAQSEKKFMLLSGPDFSIYFTVNEVIDQVQQCVLRDKSKTVFAGFLQWINAVLQVTEDEIIVATVDGKEAIHAVGLSSVMGKACGAVKSVFVVSSTQSCYVLFDDGLLAAITIHRNKISSADVSTSICAAAYWSKEEKIAAIEKDAEQMNLVIFRPGKVQEKLIFPNFGVLPAVSEEGVELKLQSFRQLGKQPLPTITHLGICDHAQGSTLICIISSGELLTRLEECGFVKTFFHLLDVERETEIIETIEAKRRRLEVEREVKKHEVDEPESGTIRLIIQYFSFFDKERNRLSLCRHHNAGSVKGFAAFDSPFSPGGYAYCSDGGSVTFAMPSYAGVPMAHGWWMQRKPLGETPHHLLYASDAQSCIVVTSIRTPFAPKKSPFDVSLSFSIDHEGKRTVSIMPQVSLPPLVSSGRNPVPMNDQFSLRLISCTDKGELDTIRLEPNEKVLCAHSCQLPCDLAADASSEPLANAYVFGTGFPLGEDVATSGRLIIVATRYNGQSHRLQLVHSEPLKGPVTAVTQVERHIAVAVGGTIRVFKFNWKAAQCETVALLYGGVYISTLSSFQQYLCFGDLYSSVTLAKFSSCTRSLTVLGKDLHRFSATQCQVMYHDSNFGLVATDDSRNLVIFGYSPRVQQLGGRPVVLESLLKVDSEYRVPGGSISQLLRFRSSRSSTNSSVMLYCTNYGEMGCLVAVGGLGPSGPYRTLQNVMKKLQSDVPHPGGLPPQVFLATPKVNPKWDFRAEQMVIHAPLIQELYRLDLQARKALAISALTQLDRTLRIGATIFFGVMDSSVSCSGGGGGFLALSLVELCSVCYYTGNAAVQNDATTTFQGGLLRGTTSAAPKLVSAVRQRNFSEAQTQAAALFQQKWREEYNLPAAFTLICLVVWYWIAWAHRSVQRKCAALEAAAEKDVRETVQVVQSISEQWRSDMLRASTEMKLIIAKNSELTGDIDRLTTALRGCQQYGLSSQWDGFYLDAERRERDGDFTGMARYVAGCCSVNGFILLYPFSTFDSVLFETSSRKSNRLVVSAEKEETTFHISEHIHIRFLTHVHRAADCAVCGSLMVNERRKPFSPAKERLTIASEPVFEQSPPGLATQTVETVEEMRRSGMQQWILRLNDGNTCEEKQMEQLLRKQKWVSENDDTLFHYLDSACKRLLFEQCPGQASETVPPHSNADLVSIPSYLKLTNTRNAFLDGLKGQIGPTALEKQRKFQISLLDVQKGLLRSKLPFFLACGTALGAHREERFISYDDDIDLGIMFHQLVDFGKRCANKEAASSDLNAIDGDNTEDDQALKGFVELCSALSHTSNVVIFDICGTVAKGLEIRLLHTSTDVRIDINVYYPPIPIEDDDLVNRVGPFVWASSFYEKAAERKHHMYRYWHKPFETELEKKAFCSLSGTIEDDAYFLVPPKSYLQEYFGENWRTPKNYTYAEGLASEFRNIIDDRTAPTKESVPFSVSIAIKLSSLSFIITKLFT